LKKKAQSLVELVLVFPILLFLLFAIIEFALYMKTVHVIQDIAVEAAVTASRRIVTSSMNSQSITNPNFNSAAKAVIDTVINRKSSLAIADLTFSYNDLNNGAEPNALYEFRSIQTTDFNGTTVPLIVVQFDYRNPLTSGIQVHISYYYKTMFLGASFPMPGSQPIVILPRCVKITSSRVQQFIMY